MSERYSRIRNIQAPLYGIGYPVMVEAGALLKDNKTNDTVLQLQFRNISDKVVKAVSVSIQGYDMFEAVAGEEVPHEYVDLGAKRDDLFGDRQAIILKEPAIKRVGIKLLWVYFADDSTWKPEDEELSPIGQTEKLTGYFDEKQLEQYRADTGAEGDLKPFIVKDLWYCSCGAINHAEEERCHKCGKEWDSLVKHLDKGRIDSELEEARKTAIYESAEAERSKDTVPALNKAIELYGTISGWRDADDKIVLCNSRVDEIVEEKNIKKAQTKKGMKRAGLIAAIAALCVAVVLLTINVFIPSAKYNKALAKVENGEYMEAIATFEELGDYKDSSEQVINAYYLQGLDLLESGEYQQALESFKKCPLRYEDSETKIKIANYNLGLAAVDEGKLDEAAGYFLNASGYEDAKEKFKEVEYNLGVQLLDAGDYKSAKPKLVNADDYSDAKEKLKQVNYNLGLEALNHNRYEEAIENFTAAKDYEGASAQLLEAKYQFVIAKNSPKGDKVYMYIKELKDANYKDSASIYNNWYGWKVSIVVNTSETDEKTDIETVSRYKTWYFHVRVTGGEPGQSVRLKYSGRFPDGEAQSGSWDFDIYDDNTTWACWYYGNPQYGSTGTFTFNVYDSNGNVLGTKTVTVTS